MLNKKIIEKYEGLSLVEMLITILIVGFVLVVVSSTLVAMIKASAISAARTLSRNESQYIENQLEKYISNSQAENITVYRFEDRYIDENGTISYGNGYLPPSPMGSGISGGNEIQFRPVGSDSYICIAFVPSNYGLQNEEVLGFIVRSESTNSGTGCISGNPVLLNAEEIDIELFDVTFYETANGNITYVFDLALKPTYWVPGKESQFHPEYYKQIVISTRMLTYY